MRRSYKSCYEYFLNLLNIKLKEAQELMNSGDYDLEIDGYHRTKALLELKTEIQKAK